MVGRDHGHYTLAVEAAEKLAALGPLPQVHLVRSGGCLASHRQLRDAVIPAPRRKAWRGRRLPRGAALEMGAVAEAGVCHRSGALPVLSAGALRIIAAITQGCQVQQFQRLFLVKRP